MILIFILALLQTTYGEINESPPTNCDLECWLNNLVINIPTQTILKDGFNITLSNMTCKGVEISSLNSSLLAANQLQCGITQIGVNCTGNWSYVYEPLPIFSGQGSMIFVVADTNLTFALEVLPGTGGFGNSSIPKQCTMQLNISYIDFEGGLSGEFFDQMKDLVYGYLIDKLDDVACAEFNNTVTNNMTQFIQFVDYLLQPYLKPYPIDIPPYVPPGMVNFMNSPFIGLMLYLANDLVGSNGTLGLNNVINAVTNNSGCYNFNLTQLLNKTQDELSTTVEVPNVGNVTFGFAQVNTSGLNTWRDFDVLEPVSNYSLSFYTSLDMLVLNVSFFVNITTGSGVLQDKFLYEEGTIILTMEQSTFNSTVQIAINESKVNRLVKDFNELSEPGCLLQTVYNFNVTQLLFNMTIKELAIVAVSGNVEKELDELISNIFELITKSFETVIPDILNGISNGPVKQQINQFVDEFLATNDYSCSDKPLNQVSGFNVFTSSIGFGIAGGVYLILSILLSLYKCHNDREEDEDTKPLLKDSISNQTDQDEPISTQVQGEIYEKKVVDTNQVDHSCLAGNSSLNVIIRYGIPLILLINVGLFISSNTSAGATVYIVLTIGEVPITLPSLFNFSLGNSIRDMWNAGVYPLSLLIAIFSGAWPYIKLLLMLFCWFIPSNILPTRRREHALMFLDAMGKWSLIDAYVLVMMMVAFRFHIQPPNVRVPQYGIPPASLSSMDVYVQAEWGFYSFMLSTILSLVTSHVILAIHRMTIEDKKEKNIIVSNKKEALCMHVFKNTTRSGPVLIALFIITSIVLVSVGSYINSFTFSIKGAAGLVLDYLGLTSTHDYSLITLGASIPGASEFPNSPGQRFVQSSFFAFALVIPLAHLFFLLILWVVPMTQTVQKNFYKLTEVFNAWSALEVFVLSLITALLEIRQFAQFVIGDKCDLLNPILKKYFDHELNGDDKCFDVIPALTTGCWLLFVACVIYIVASILIMRACHKAIEGRQLKVAATIPIGINEPTEIIQD